MAESAEQLATALAEVLSQFGRRVVDRPAQLRGALSDTLGSSAGDHRSGLDAVVAASEEGVAGQIRDADPHVAASPEQIRAWFDQLVTAGVSLRDAALATRSWAEVFDASETARATSELSVELLGADAGAPATSVGSVSSSVGSAESRPRSDTSSAVPAAGAAAAASLVRGAGLEDPTDLGDGSVLGEVDADRTRVPAPVERTASPPPRPDVMPGAAVATAPNLGGDVGGGGSDPDLNPTVALSETREWVEPAAAAGTESASRRVLAWAPTMLAVVAVIIALLIALPTIEHNLAETPYDPVAAAAIPGLGEPVTDDAPLLSVSEMESLLLSEAELKDIVPKSAYVNEPLKAEPWSLNQAVSTKGCEAALRLDAGGETLYRSAIGTGGVAGAWAAVYSTGQWYETQKAAQEAFDALKVAPGCTKAAMVQTEPRQTTPVSATQGTGTVGDGSVLRTTVTRTDGNAFRFERHCYLRTNVVVCYIFTGYEAGRIAGGWQGANRVKGLDRVASVDVTASQFEVIP